MQKKLMMVMLVALAVASGVKAVDQVGERGVVSLLRSPSAPEIPAAGPTVKLQPLSLQEAQRLKLKPRSGLDSQGAFASLSSLWSLLNPFATTEAQALGSYYSLVLTPQAPQSYNPPLNYLSLSGVFYTSNPGYSTYLLNNIPSTALGSTITKPYAYVFVQLPLAGWYLIDFYGNGKPKVTLRAAAAQYPATLPVLESWDMTASPNSLNHFVTVEPLAQGEHSLLFMIDTGYLYPYYVAVYSF